MHTSVIHARMVASIFPEIRTIFQILLLPSPTTTPSRRRKSARNFFFLEYRAHNASRVNMGLHDFYSSRLPSKKAMLQHQSLNIASGFPKR